uniref:Uncharacterized protein n=1 Tax=Panagrolaimus davidi TaxID=227884 RepID=A0A914QSP7_9BILA
MKKILKFINTLEKELKAAKNTIIQFENQNESFELEEDKSKLELELEKANEKQKKCEVEIAQMKQRIDGLENQNKQLKEKVFPTDERIPSGEESDTKENEMPIQIKASPGESYKTNCEIAQTNHRSQSNPGANQFSEFSELGNLLGGGGAGGMPDIGSLMNDP